MLDVKSKLNLPPRTVDFKRPEFWTTRTWQVRPPEPPAAPFEFPEDDLIAKLVHLYFEKINLFFPLLHRVSHPSAVCSVGLTSTSQHFNATSTRRSITLTITSHTSFYYVRWRCPPLHLCSYVVSVCLRGSLYRRPSSIYRGVERRAYGWVAMGTPGQGHPPEHGPEALSV